MPNSAFLRLTKPHIILHAQLRLRNEMLLSVAKSELLLLHFQCVYFHFISFMSDKLTALSMHC